MPSLQQMQSHASAMPGKLASDFEVLGWGKLWVFSVRNVDRNFEILTSAIWIRIAIEQAAYLNLTCLAYFLMTFQATRTRTRDTPNVNQIITLPWFPYSRKAMSTTDCIPGPVRCNFRELPKIEVCSMTMRKRIPASCSARTRPSITAERWTTRFN